MVDDKTILPLSFLRMSRFTGSDRGMRYVVKKIEKEEISYLEVSACPGPFSVDHTDPALFETIEFPFTDEGRLQAANWLNEYYDKNRELLEDVFAHPAHYYTKHKKADSI